MASSDVELLQEIVKELKGLRSDLNEFKVETRQGFAELRNDLKFTHSVLGELQGDIEELQADTEYLAMRRLIDKRKSHPKIFNRTDKE